MLSYINLHTHRKPQLAHERVLRNAFVPRVERIKEIQYGLSCGIHPWLIKTDWKEQVERLEALATLPQVLAIGECGLDRVKGAEWNMQCEVLEAHILLANRCNKPLILHLVKTYSDILSLAKRIQVPWMLHGFKGNSTEAHQLIGKGARLSFGPRLQQEASLQQVFAALPLEHIYLETDVRPVRIDQHYAFAASLRNTSVEELQEGICLNFARDFQFV